jgi:hypothetical protein
MSGPEEAHTTNHHSELAALNQIRSELKKLSDDELLQQNVVAIDVLATVRGVLRELMGLRPLMLQLLNFNVEHIDRLELYAMAFAGAHAQYQILKEHNKEPAVLIREGLALRSRLVNDVRVLVRRGLVAPEPLRKLHNQRSYTKLRVGSVAASSVLPHPIGGHFREMCHYCRRDCARRHARRQAHGRRVASPQTPRGRSGGPQSSPAGVHRILPRL